MTVESNDFYKAENTLGSFLPFHRVVSVLYADSVGFTSFIESRLFGRRVSRKVLLPMTRWQEIKRIELAGNGDGAELVAFPKDATLFRKPISTITGPKHWKTGEEGSIIVSRGARAKLAYDYFARFLPASEQ